MAVAASNDIYLALLAGRAVTALAKLASDPRSWNDETTQDIRDGLAFCEAVSDTERAADERIPEFAQTLKRLTAGVVPAEAPVSRDEVDRTTVYLRELLEGKRQPLTEELSRAVDFFCRASSGHTVMERHAGSI